MIKYKNIHRYILLTFIIVITILIFKEIENNLCISVIGDEFGYWSGAAFILNKPWHSVASTNSYYGFGYGILLAPIMLFCGDAASEMYKVSILLNGLMLCGILLIVYNTALIIQGNSNKLLCAFLSGAVTIFPSSMYGIFNSMPEILLLLITWTSFYISLIMFKNKEYKLFYLYFLILIGVFAFAVHQRAIGLFVANFTTVFLYCIQRGAYTKKSFFAMVLVSLCVLGIVFIVKDNYKKWLYSTTVMENVIENDFGSIIASKKNIFSIYAIKNFLISIIGKIYYFGSTTFLLGIVGIASCLKNIFRKKNSEINIAYVLACLQLIQAIAISSIFMMNGFETRTDILIYGRYIEYAMMPLMLIGIINLIKKKYTIKEISIMLIFYLLTTIIVSKNIAADSINTNMGNIFSLANAFCIKNMRNCDAIFFNGLRAIVIFFFIYLFFMKKSNNHYMQYLIIIVIAIININTFITVYEGNILPWQEKANECISAVEIYKQQKEDKDSLYIYDGGIGTKMLQFLLPNEECIRTESLDFVPENSILMTQYNKSNEESISKDYEIMYKNSIVILWRK